MLYGVKEGLKTLMREVVPSFTLFVHSLVASLTVAGLIFFLLFSLEVKGRTTELMAVRFFVSDSISSDEIRVLMERIKSVKGVKKVVFLSKERALELLGQKVGLDFSSLLPTNPLQSSFKVWFEPGEMEKGVRQIINYDGIESCDYSQRKIFLHRLNFFLSFFFSLVSGFILLVSSALFLAALFTINLVAYHRKREIGVKLFHGLPLYKLFFPFVIEAVVPSTSASLLALAVAVFVYTRLSFYVSHYLNFVPFPPLALYMRVCVVVVLALSFSTSFMGSVMAIWKYLENHRVADSLY
jgi:cell division protein FtsX